jgi:uncharacterized protein (TIGR03118 family)
MIQHRISKKLLVIAALVAMAGGTVCQSQNNPATIQALNSPYTATILVADTLGFGAAHVDPTYVNGWGISVGSSGIFWLSSNGGGVTDIYDGTGTSALNAIAVPSRNGTDPGSPSGVVFNTTGDFNGEIFIYSTEDGIIAAWDGNMSKVATSTSANAVYKGLAIGTSAGANFLYATDFRNGKIDVYDKTFTPVTNMQFSDPAIPAGYAPFGITNIGGLLFVTYALHKGPDNKDDQAGVGNGYIDVFNPNGTLVKNFASTGTLNSPWGIAAAPATFGDFKNAILVSNFGDGTINGYDVTGTYLGQLKDESTNPLHIDGLWGLMFTSTSGNNPNALYFTAGPNGESHGLFGFLTPQSSSVNENPSLTSQLALRIFPNPAQSSASLSFTLGQRMFVSASVVDALGREVLSLGSGWREAGIQELRFDTKDLPNGAYYCRLQTGGQSVLSTFVVLR